MPILPMEIKVGPILAMKNIIENERGITTLPSSGMSTEPLRIPLYSIPEIPMVLPKLVTQNIYENSLPLSSHGYDDR